MIPNRIIYTWFGQKPYPNSFLKFKEQWMKLNKDTEIFEINEQNFDINYCLFTKQAYSSGKMAFVSDVARIWAINRYGGIYLDTDVELIKKLKNIFKQNNQFWAEESPGMVNSGLAFGSTKNNQVLKEILKIYTLLDLRKVDNIKDITTVKIVSKVLKNYGLTMTNKCQKLSNGSYVYGPQYFAPLHYWGGGKISNKTIGVHHYNASWTDNKKHFLKYLGHEVFFKFPILNKIIYH